MNRNLIFRFAVVVLLNVVLLVLLIGLGAYSWNQFRSGSQEQLRLREQRLRLEKQHMTKQREALTRLLRQEEDQRVLTEDELREILQVVSNRDIQLQQMTEQRNNNTETAQASIKVSFSGAYKDIIEFVYGLEWGYRNVRVQRLSLQSEDRKHLSGTLSILLEDSDE